MEIFQKRNGQRDLYRNIRETIFLSNVPLVPFHSFRNCHIFAQFHDRYKPKIPLLFPTVVFLLLFCIFQFEMKRKLPQWLLDATNNNNSQATSKRNSNESQNIDTNNFCIAKPEQNFRSTNGIQTNGTISVVPLANLQSSYDDQSNDPSRNIPTSNNVETTTLPVAVKLEKIDPTESSTTDVSNERQEVVVKEEIKDEPMDTASTVTSSPTSSAISIPKIESVKPERRSCNYGIKCFR